MLPRFKLIMITVWMLCISCIVSAFDVNAYVIPLQKEIGASTWLYTQEGFKHAAAQNADLILIHMNTYGGEVVYADSIRTRILNSRKPVYVFIDNNAASAGALIAIACDKIYMRPGANIGAATVVNGMDGKAMPDKYQSYMRATIRATAEAQGKDTIYSSTGDTVIQWHRNPQIAEAMVDERIRVEGISDSGKILTFTAQEALMHGYCDGIAESCEEALEQALQGKNYSLETYSPSVKDEIKGFFMGSVIRSILIMIIIGGIYYELQTPGIGFPIAASAVAAVLYFVPLFIDGLAAYWEVLLFLAGVFLMLAEVFILPGFGFAGISGILCMSVGLLLSMVGNNGFDFSVVDSELLTEAALTVTIGITGGLVIILLLAQRIGKGALRRIALETTQEVEKGYLSVGNEGFSLVGCTGIAKTMLRPSGKVTIGDKVYDAITPIGYIEQGTPVKVIRYESGQLYVEKL